MKILFLFITFTLTIPAYSLSLIEQPTVLQRMVFKVSEIKGGDVFYNTTTRCEAAAGLPRELLKQNLSKFTDCTKENRQVLAIAAEYLTSKFFLLFFPATPYLEANHSGFTLARGSSAQEIARATRVTSHRPDIDLCFEFKGDARNRQCNPKENSAYKYSGFSFNSRQIEKTVDQVLVRYLSKTLSKTNAIKELDKLGFHSSKALIASLAISQKKCSGYVADTAVLKVELNPKDSFEMSVGWLVCPRFPEEIAIKSSEEQKALKKAEVRRLDEIRQLRYELEKELKR